ncbi:unnamed protein product [Rangifer tarandus platyrhynchus]|uniref:Uncharacterized protein n=1 Tax=Rangifer tarandus platyrhynchus TaxID=3082113 RepID=A0ABN8XJA1_RANTA|nr:unnamed protein product [Rangifer tarandus platyrhynchus]
MLRASNDRTDSNNERGISSGNRGSGKRRRSARMLHFDRSSSTLRDSNNNAYSSNQSCSSGNPWSIAHAQGGSDSSSSGSMIVETTEAMQERCSWMWLQQASPVLEVQYPAWWEFLTVFGDKALALMRDTGDDSSHSSSRSVESRPEAGVLVSRIQTSRFTHLACDAGRSLPSYPLFSCSSSSSPSSGGIGPTGTLSKSSSNDSCGNTAGETIGRLTGGDSGSISSGRRGARRHVEILLSRIAAGSRGVSCRGEPTDSSASYEYHEPDPREFAAARNSARDSPAAAILVPVFVVPARSYVQRAVESSTAGTDPPAVISFAATDAAAAASSPATQSHPAEYPLASTRLPPAHNANAFIYRCRRRLGRSPAARYYPEASVGSAAAATSEELRRGSSFACLSRSPAAVDTPAWLPVPFLPTMSVFLTAAAGVAESSSPAASVPDAASREPSSSDSASVESTGVSAAAGDGVSVASNVASSPVYSGAAAVSSTGFDSQPEETEYSESEQSATANPGGSRSSSRSRGSCSSGRRSWSSGQKELQEKDLQLQQQQKELEQRHKELQEKHQQEQQRQKVMQQLLPLVLQLAPLLMQLFPGLQQLPQWHNQLLQCQNTLRQQQGQLLQQQQQQKQQEQQGSLEQTCREQHQQQLLGLLPADGGRSVTSRRAAASDSSPPGGYSPQQQRPPSASISSGRSTSGEQSLKLASPNSNGETATVGDVTRSPHSRSPRRWSATFPSVAAAAAAENQPCLPLKALVNETNNTGGGQSHLRSRISTAPFQPLGRGVSGGKSGGDSTIELKRNNSIGSLRRHSPSSSFTPTLPHGDSIGSGGDSSSSSFKRTGCSTRSSAPEKDLPAVSSCQHSVAHERNERNSKPPVDRPLRTRGAGNLPPDKS